MNSAVFNSRMFVNHSSSGSSPLLWYEFEVCKETPYAFVFAYMVRVFNIVVGFPTNILVIWQVVRKKSDSSTSDIFILNLAISDAFYCLMTPIDQLNRLLLSNSYLTHLQNFAYGIKDTTPLFLTCICLDRYMAVVHPIVFSGIRDNKIRVVVSMIVWGLMSASALTKSILGVESTINIFTGIILGALTIMVFCNVSIIWTLRKSVMGKEKMHPVKKKALTMVALALAIIVFTYLPPVALFPFVGYYSIVEFKCYIAVVVFSLMDLSCSIEPLLYISKMDQWLPNLPCSCCPRPSNEPNKVST